MIGRDEVLHVARLARLELGEGEIERMSKELSSVLGHIERISELDLEDVAPTSHVIDIDNVLREDVARPSWPREAILDPAPDATGDSFQVPSPGQ